MAPSFRNGLFIERRTAMLLIDPSFWIGLGAIAALVCVMQVLCWKVLSKA